MRSLFLTILIGMYSLCAHSQNQTKAQYIEKWAPTAMANMKKYHIPASIILAQGILESQWGNSELARRSNNHFGIKCHKDWKGKRVYHDDDAKGECFRHYNDAAESFEDHALFLHKNSRYHFLFELDVDDYEEWAYGLKKAGYATDPGYPKKLIRIIEENKLYEFDRGVDVDEYVAENNTQDNNSSNETQTEGKGSKPGMRKIQNKNWTDYVVVKEGDKIEKLNEELELLSWEIYFYNDIEEGTELKPGQILYLQPKPWKSERKYKYHTAKEGETMWDIAQEYAVDLGWLLWRNRMEEGQKPATGQKIHLRRRIPGQN